MRNTKCNKKVVAWLIEEVMRQFYYQLVVIIEVIIRMKSRKRKRSSITEPYNMLCRIPDQVKHLSRLTTVSDVDCILNLRMDRNTFGRLCNLLKQLGSLEDGRYVSVEEQVTMFLSILAHHKKNRVVRFDFWRSGQTISHYVHIVLKALLKIHVLLLVKPQPVPEECNDSRWKWFKGCLGALDGTYISVLVPNIDKARYRTRKGQIATNMLRVCDQNMKFVYVLPGWEGSAADSRILRDALNRPHGLRVPRGNYYLVDSGYANSEGFLAPYKGVRYHLKEWGPTCARPQNAEELFNLRHAKARNVIERAFGVLKMRWGILRSTSYYPIKVQVRLMMACVLLENFIRSNMAVDPVEQQYDLLLEQLQNMDEEQEDCVDTIDSSQAWNAERDALAHGMWQQYLHSVN